jgi:phosphoserine phosphatase
MESGTLILCDICDSLYRSNTTFDFVSFHLRRKSTPLRFWFVLISNRLSPLFWLLELAGKMTRRDYVRICTLHLLKGHSLAEMDAMAFEFLDFYLADRRNPEVWEIIQRFSGAQLAVISSTIDPVARAIATQMRALCFSSRLEIRNGVLTGRLEKDMTGQKHKVALAWKKDHPKSKLVVITDNRSDHQLVSMADERYVVIRRQTDMAFWNALKPTFINA